MAISFEAMTMEHSKDAMDIFNYYIENSFAAYIEQKLPYEFFGKIIEMSKGYPSYIIKNDNTQKVIGFCYLRAYYPMLAFRQTAELSYFISSEETGKGIGKKALAKLEQEAVKMGIKHLLASISSRNEQSLMFHRNNGFKECGRLHEVGIKKGEPFDVVWMEKDI